MAQAPLRRGTLSPPAEWPDRATRTSDRTCPTAERPLPARTPTVA